MIGIRTIRANVAIHTAQRVVTLRVNWPWLTKVATILLIAATGVAASDEGAVLPSIPRDTMELPTPTSTERLAALRRGEDREGPAFIGFGRDVSNLLGTSAGVRDLTWETTSDGEAVATIVLTSPSASALRAQLVLSRVPDDLQVSFYDPRDVEDTLERISANELASSQYPTDEGYLYWSPTIKGDHIGIELRIASGSSHHLTVSIPKISHLNQTLDDYVHFTKTSCSHTDAVCHNDRISDTARSSVARYLYTTSSGDTSNCTGTLLNDQDLATQIPYFLTADHCMSSEAEVASTEFYWYHETPTCGDQSELSTVQQGRGATRLAREGWYICASDDSHCPGADMTLLRLHQKPPFGAGLAGWTTNPVELQDDVVVLHHPGGEIKKILIGTIVPHKFPGNKKTHALIRPTVGFAVGGSSGSGIWRRDSAGDYLVGTLSGSSGNTCPPNERVTFGRFNTFQPRIADWIGFGSVSEEIYIDGQIGFLLREPLGSVLGTLDDGDVIDLSVVGTGPFNIQVGFSLAVNPASVTFELTGPSSTTRTSNAVPHRLIPAGGGMGFAPGSYSLSAIAYDGADGSGNELERQSITFTVSGAADDTDLRVASLWLADSSDGTVFGEIVDGGSLLVNRSIDASLELRTVTAGTGSVASVGYALSGPTASTGTVNGSPFDWPVSLPPGTYSVTATPYPDMNGGGVSGTSVTRTAFSVDYSPALVPVRRFVLVDASDGSEVMELLSGAVLDLDTTDSRSFNIRAELTDGAGVETVQMDLTGPLAVSRLSGGAPHTLHGVNGGGPLVAGDYTVTATPYAKYAADTPLPTRSVSFSVIGGAGETDVAVTRLTLINGTTGLELATLTNGTVVHVPSRSNKPLAIRADTRGAAVGSVSFEISGPSQAVQSVDTMPFTWQGNLTPGTYSFTATPQTPGGISGTAYSVTGIEIAYAYATALERVTLVDSGSRVETDVSTLVDGITVDLASTSKRMRLRVELVPRRAKSVRVRLSGPVSVEFLHDDDESFWVFDEIASGGVIGRALPNGNYTLTLTLYEESGGTGFNWTNTLRFTVTGSYDHTDSPIAGFTLVDAEGPPPDPDLASVVNSAQIDLSSTSARSLTLKADLADDPRQLAGVAFELTGPVAKSKRENGSAPYSLYGEAGSSDYLGDLLPDGDYTITATPYSAEAALDPASDDGDLRLVGGNGLADGRVELRRDGAWGTVCDAGWDLDDADVVCRQLGIGDALRAPSGAAYGEGTGSISLGNVQCVGNEADLLSCPSGGTGGCVHANDAGAVCAGTPLTALTRQFTIVNSSPSNPVESFTAIRAGGTPTSIGTVSDGDTLDLSGTGFEPLTFRADIPADTEGTSSVRLTLNGLVNASRIDNDGDYTLHPFDTSSGRYNDGVRLLNGAYSISATAFSEADGAGTSFGTVTAQFTVTGSNDTPASISNFALIDPHNPTKVLATITDGAQLDLNILANSTQGIDIRPVLDSQGPMPGSVRLQLSGTTSASRLTNDAPFKLFGDGTLGDADARLAIGVHTLTGTVYAESDGSGWEGPPVTVRFTVTTRPAHWDEFALGQPVPGTFFPSGLFSDGTTTWVSDLNSGRILAYRSWEAVRVPSRDIASDGQAAGLWSDGTTLLVADYAGGRLVAHRLADGSRVRAQDIQLEARNAAPSGVWSDGVVLLVADYQAKKVFGYSRLGVRRPDLDIDVSANVDRPWGLWSNGQTVWVADWRNGGVRAYSLGDASRRASSDIETTIAGNPNPMGMHAEGARMWVTDSTHKSVHVYQIPETSSIEASVWSTTMIVGDRDARGFSSIATGGVGSLEDVAFEHEGSTHQIQIVVATSEGVTFKTRSGGDTFAGLVLEWAGVVLPLDESTKSAYSTFTWPQSWLDANAPILNITTYETTLPIGGVETVCLRTGSVTCPRVPVFADGASASRSVLENASSGTEVGAAVTAIGVTGQTLTYSLAGPHASKFSIDPSTGQLATAEILDHEIDDRLSVTVSAMDGYNGASSIPVDIVVTNVIEPPDAPSAPTVSGVSSTALNISWNTPAHAGRPAVTDFDIRYKTGVGSYVDWPHEGTATYSTLSELQSNTTYQVQVLARNSEGTSAWSPAGEGSTRAADDSTLIAWFEGGPTAHDGVTEFTITLKFNAVVSTLVRRLRHDRLSVTNGEITGMRRVNRTPEGAAEFAVRITPSSREAVTITLPADGTSCDAGGVCTADGIQLTEGATATVPGPAEESLRVADGNSDKEGRLEIYHDGIWGTVCDDQFTTEDAIVACRQLGYSSGTAHRRAAFGTGQGPIWVDGVQCAGSESRLADCTFPSWGLNNCNHSEDVSVSCGSAARMAVTSGTVVGMTLTLRYDRLLDEGSVPSPEDFVVEVHTVKGANMVSVESVAVADEVLVLNLSNAIISTGAVSVSYLPGSMHQLQDTSYNPAPIFIARSVARVSDATLHNNARVDEVLPDSLAKPASESDLVRGSKNEALDLSSRTLVDLTELEGLTDVEVLNLGDNYIADLWPLAGMTGLEVLNLSDNVVVDLSAIRYVPNLRLLDLSGNSISDVSALASLKALRRLDLSGNSIADLRPLSELQSLQVLLLGGNEISDVSVLRGISELVHLDLRNNHVTDISALRDARSIQRLNLEGNRLGEVSGLRNLSKLVWLRLSDNPFIDYSTLQRLSTIRWLWIDAGTSKGDVVPLRTDRRVPVVLIDTAEE